MEGFFRESVRRMSLVCNTTISAICISIFLNKAVGDDISILIWPKNARLATFYEKWYTSHSTLAQYKSNQFKMLFKKIGFVWLEVENVAVLKQSFYFLSRITQRFLVNLHKSDDTIDKKLKSLRYRFQFTIIVLFYLSTNLLVGESSVLVTLDQLQKCSCCKTKPIWGLIWDLNF